MFQVIFHPSSRAHNTVSTVSGIIETVTAICRERPATFTTGSSTGLINARYCRYSVMSSWWWVKYHLKHVEQLIDLNKLYSVESCWTIIAILYDARSTEHKIYVQLLFCLKSWRLLDNVENVCRAEQATDEIMAHVHCRLNTKGYKYTLIAFPLQQWFHERASMLRLYVHCLSC